jgi:hypothetical protein
VLLSGDNMFPEIPISAKFAILTRCFLFPHITTVAPALIFSIHAADNAQFGSAKSVQPHRLS